MSGLWSGSHQERHINYLELKAALLASQYFCEQITYIHVELFLNNTVALKYRTTMGGRIPHLIRRTVDIWEWCKAGNIWLLAYHIPCRGNIMRIWNGH